MGGEDVIISGHIKFANDPPKDPLPKPSLLVVKLQDCRRADCNAIDIGEVEVDAHSMYGDGGSLSYSMRVKNFIYDMDYNMSAVLNVGWVPDKGKDEWIRRGDYLNDTTHRLCVSDQQMKKINFDILVVHYT